MKRHKDIDWSLPTLPDGRLEDYKYVPMALLMDIRDELKQLNRVFACHNFQAVPTILREIRRNTAKRKKPRAIGKPKLRVVSRS